MTVSSDVIGTASPPVTMTVERGRLRLFAKATGQTDRRYVDLAVAEAHGHPDLPIPPTFLFAVELEQPDPFGWLSGLGVDLSRVLHGGQAFNYLEEAYAGDTLTA